MTYSLLSSSESSFWLLKSKGSISEHYFSDVEDKNELGPWLSTFKQKYDF